MFQAYAAFRATIEQQRKGVARLARAFRSGGLTEADSDERVRSYHQYVQWLADSQLHAIVDSSPHHSAAFTLTCLSESTRQALMFGASPTHSPWASQAALRRTASSATARTGVRARSSGKDSPRRISSLHSVFAPPHAVRACAPHRSRNEPASALLDSTRPRVDGRYLRRIPCGRVLCRPRSGVPTPQDSHHR